MVTDSLRYLPVEDRQTMLAGLDTWDRFRNKTILITGGAGFLGSWFLHAIAHANDTVNRGGPTRMICVDTFGRGRPPWLNALGERSDLEIIKTSIAALTPDQIPVFDFAIHAASIASPVFYRQYPIETMTANVQGTRILMETCVARGRAIESVLVMSSSEIYGQPSADWIPTPEDYLGYVSCTGPRACYDESKRYSETLCVNFHRVHGVPVKIARPFNNYGPLFSIDDGRLVPDIGRAIVENRDIQVMSDGTPTRTFCYAADATVGFLRLLLSPHDGEPFNIGSDHPELTVAELAELSADVAAREFGVRPRVVRARSDDPHYLTDNPQRRCPDIRKARQMLGFDPAMEMAEGLRRTLRWYRDTYGKTA